MKTVTAKPRRGGRLSPEDRIIGDLADLFKSLADVKRLQILALLMREGKMHVSRICEELGGESQPAVSHHLTQLKHAELVDYERDGKFNHYYISSDSLRALLEHFYPEAGKVTQTLEFGDLTLTFKAR